MRLIQIDTQCNGRFIEVIPEDKEKTEFLVEELVGHILLDFCATVIMDEVIITVSPTPCTEQQTCCFIYIQAHCDLNPCASCTQDVEGIELALEGKVSSAFMEFFEMVDIERVTISSSSTPIIML